MRKLVWMAVSAAAVAAVGCAAEAQSASSTSAQRSASETPEGIFEAEQFTGVPPEYTGTTSPLRGVNGGGLPWVIGKGEARLSAAGVLDVEVTGLVFDPTSPAVIARGLAGLNNVPAFRAILSCQSILDGHAAVVNVPTGPFAATQGLATVGGGNVHIVQQITVPRPCIAPIVFVTSPALAWFAATGF